MPYVNLINRTSTAYRFTIQSLDDPQLAALRKMVSEENEGTSRWNKVLRNNPTFGKLKHLKRVTVKARGPRDGNYYVTPRENATHFDVYVQNRYVYE